MTERRTVFLDSKRGRDRAARLAMEAPEDWVARFGQRTRTDEQNKALWARIKDIQDQVPGMEAFSAEDIKCRFMHALGAEMRFLPELEGAGMFPVGFRSSQLTVAQFSGLIELLNEYGARHGVQWSKED